MFDAPEGGMPVSFLLLIASVITFCSRQVASPGVSLSTARRGACDDPLRFIVRQLAVIDSPSHKDRTSAKRTNRRR